MESLLVPDNQCAPSAPAPREPVLKAALAHMVRNKAEIAYTRSDLFERRRALMQSWSDYLAA